MIRQGISHTTTSIAVECDHSGSYRAPLLPARYFHANASVITMTGITTSNISHVAVRIRDFSVTPIWPLGSRTVRLLQPASSKTPHGRSRGQRGGFGIFM